MEVRKIYFHFIDFYLFYLIELKVTFECDISEGRWSQPVSELEIKDRMIVFKTPIYPYSFEVTKDVDVILRQDNHIIEIIKYYYLATGNLKNYF
jgi:hypothetical protein